MSRFAPAADFVYEVVEYYDNQRTIVGTTDDLEDARAIRRWQMDQWSNPTEAAKAVRIENRKI